MDKYTVYKYDIANIFKNGILNKNDKTIDFLSSYDSDYEVCDNLDNCFLFDQIQQIIKDVPLKEVLVLIDFKNFKNNILKLQNFDNGIKLNIDGKIITFDLFIKSQKMSSSLLCFYINKDYKDLIYRRIALGLQKDKLQVSKWNYMLGLSLDSVTILNDINLNEDEVVIIDDKISNTKVNCISAVSVRYFLNLLDKYQHNLENDKSSNNIYNELEHYRFSVDYDTLDNDIKHLLDEILSLFKLTKKEALERCKVLKDDYIKYRSNKIKWNKIEVTDYDLTINHFNGVGLISNEFNDSILNSLSKENKNYSNKYSYEIRLPFLKGMVHTADLKQFFKDHNITSIKSIKNFNNGKNDYEYKDANKVKMIISESMFKASKYLKGFKLNKKYNSQINYYFTLLNKYNYHLGIVNVSNEDYNLKLNYQFLSTLPLEEDDINHVINLAKEEVREQGELKYVKDFLNGSDYLMADKYRDYYLNTKRYLEKRDENLNRAKREVLLGNIKCNSIRRYLAPDLLDFLYTVIDSKFDENEYLDENHFYVDAKDDDQQLYDIILRNPHISRNEIVVSKKFNKIDSERNKYFAKLDKVIMINPLSCYANRLGNAIYDGASVLCIENSSYVKDIYNRLLDKGKYVYKLANIPTIEEENSALNYQTRVNSLNNTFIENIDLISDYAFYKIVNNEENVTNELPFLTILNGLENNSIINGCQPLLIKDDFKDYLFLNILSAIKDNKLDSPYYFTNKKVIKEIEKLKNQHYLYHILSEINKYNPKAETSLKPNNYKEYLSLNNNYSYEGKLKVIGLVSGYKKLVSLNKIYMNSLRQYYVNQEIIEYWVKNNINDELNYKDYLAYFKTKNPSKLLKTYCNNYYHFMTNKEDKINFIKNDLGLNLPDHILKYLLNDNGRNYGLLYICLLYWKEDEMIHFQLDYSSLDNSPEIEKINEKDKEIAINVRNEMMKNIINLNPLGKWNESSLLEACKDYINKNFSYLTFNEIGNSMNLLKDSVMFDLFNDFIVSYYESKGDNNE